MVKLHRFLKGLLAVYTVIIAIFICWQCVDMYRDAYSPEMLSDRGTLLEPVYTPDKIAVRINGVLAVSSAYPIVLFGVLVLGRFDSKKPVGVSNDPEYSLMRLKKRAGVLPEAAVREEKLRQRLKTGRICILIICASGCAAYLLNRNNFASWDLEPVMGSMLRHVLPWLAIAFVSGCIFSELERRSAVRETAVLKDAPKASEKQDGKATRCISINVIRWILLGVAAVLVILGIVNGDSRSVMAKAIRICTECIGLG